MWVVKIWLTRIGTKKSSDWGEPIGAEQRAWWVYVKRHPELPPLRHEELPPAWLHSLG
jgi:hypothetical protein